MTRERLHKAWRLAIPALVAVLPQTACLRTISREMEILYAPEANLDLVYDSLLVKWFGPGVLEFW